LILDTVRCHPEELLRYHDSTKNANAQ